MENKETLEQASKEFANSKKWMDKGAESWVEHTFIEGAKWQQERMYSGEECYKIIHNLMTNIKLQGLIINDDIDLKRWFETIKNK